MNFLSFPLDRPLMNRDKRTNPITTDGEVLQKLRTLCLSLPETSERASWGHPNFLAGKKTFVTFERIRGRPSIGFRLEVSISNDSSAIRSSSPHRTAVVNGSVFGWIPPSTGASSETSLCAAIAS
jgi:hypothetical protein